MIIFLMYMTMISVDITKFLLLIKWWCVAQPCIDTCSLLISFCDPLYVIALLGSDQQFLLALKVQLTPKNVFRLYKFPCFSDHRCEKIIVVAIFVNFL